MPIAFVLALSVFGTTGVRAGRVFLALYALKLGASPFQVGVLAATFSLLPMSLAWLAGRLSDRYGSRWPVLYGACGGALGMLVPYFLPGLPALYLAAAMNGFAFTFYNVSLQNLVGLMSDSENRATNFANFTLALSVAGFLGPLLCGFSIDHTSYSLTCVVIAAMSVVPVVMLAGWGGALPKGMRVPKGGHAKTQSVHERGLLRVLATSSLVVSGVDLFQFYMPIYGHSIGLSASAIGMVLAMFSAAAFVVRLVLPRLIASIGAERVLRYAFYLGAASFVVLPFFKGAFVLAVIAFIFGLGMGCGQPITMMMTFSSSATGRSGEIMGLRISVNHFTRVVGPMLFGWIGSAFGLPPVFWANALLLGSGGLWSYPGRKHKAPPADASSLAFDPLAESSGKEDAALASRDKDKR
jgi:MFS family permease